MEFQAAMAESELLNEPKDEADELAKKYRGGTTATVENELDQLEVELGLKTSSEVEAELDKLTEELGMEEM